MFDTFFSFLHKFLKINYKVLHKLSLQLVKKVENSRELLFSLSN